MFRLIKPKAVAHTSVVPEGDRFQFLMNRDNEGNTIGHLIFSKQGEEISHESAHLYFNWIRQLRNALCQRDVLMAKNAKDQTVHALILGCRNDLVIRVYLQANFDGLCREVDEVAQEEEPLRNITRTRDIVLPSIVEEDPDGKRPTARYNNFFTQPLPPIGGGLSAFSSVQSTGTDSSMEEIPTPPLEPPVPVPARHRKTYS